MSSAIIKVKSPAKILNKAGKERRSVGKILNLAATYGMNGRTAGIRLGYEGSEAKEKGEELLNNFFKGFSGVKNSIEASKEFLAKNGYVEDFVGRRRRLEDIRISPYEAKLKIPTIVSANFNPFLNCSDRASFDDAETVWDMILRAYSIMAQCQHIWSKQSKLPGEMSNKTFEWLKKIAANPAVMLNEKTSDNKYAKLNSEKLFGDLTGTFTGILLDKQYRGRLGKDKLDFSLADEHGEYKDSGLRRLVEEYRTKYGNNIPTRIPEESVILYAWTGRIAQASRQCFNARIQGCLDYNSIICTRDGLKKIGDLANQTIEVFDGDGWSSAIVLPSGKKQKCILTTEAGHTIICSPDHKFLTIETNGKKSFKKLSELKIQDKLIYAFSSSEFVNKVDLSALSNINYQKITNQNGYSFDDTAEDFIQGELSDCLNKKQKDALTKLQHEWPVTAIKDIVITNEFVDMYDVCNTERGYFVVNGLITHNSAASLTKLAMVDIFRDERLKKMNAYLIITVHDEVLVECPEQYADEVEKILPEIMVNAAYKAGDDVPQACDPYNVTRWYSDTASAFIQEEFKKLEAKGFSRDEALEEVIKAHSEVPAEAIKKSIETGCDLDF